MRQKTVGIRELKAHLSGLVREVREGATLVITDRGEAVARIVPMPGKKEDKFKQLLDTGMVAWSGERLPARVPRVPARGPKTVAELLIEDRE
ncbi:MAG TPA: type II toxin-antitoxin system prevent-host-death family antitoxin [Thermoanaerobaculia bacterium]